MRATTRQQYEARVEAVVEEVLADAYAGMNMFDAGATQFTDTVREFMEENNISRKPGAENGVRETNGPPADGKKENTAGYGGERYAYDYSKSFAEQLEDYQNGLIPKGDTLLVGATPKVFRNIGMAPLPITINTTHIDYALNGTKDFDHHLGKALLSQLPQALESPVAIMTSGTKSGSSIVVMLEIRHNGKQVVVPVVVDGFGKQNGILIDSNAITSAYGKNNSISKVLHDAIQQEINGQFRLYYLDKNKATGFLQKARVPMPKNFASTIGGYIHSIADPNSPVKSRIADITQTMQFESWFGDWQNNPKNASKVVNADGTPKVVYHGSYKNFSVFDGNAQKHSAAPKGAHFFTDSIDAGFSYTGYKDVAKPGGHAYKGGIYPVYLNIRNPLRIDFGGLVWNEKVDGRDVNEWAQYAKDNKYDGLIVENVIDEGGNGDRDWNIDPTRVPATDYVVFDSTQIKSATDNIGTFNGTNPDIRYSVDTISEAEDGRQEEPLRADIAGQNVRAYANAHRKDLKPQEEAWRKRMREAARERLFDRMYDSGRSTGSHHRHNRKQGLSH